MWQALETSKTLSSPSGIMRTHDVFFSFATFAFFIRSICFYLQRAPCGPSQLTCSSNVQTKSSPSFSVKSVARFIKIQRLKKRCFFVSFSFVYFLPEFCAEYHPQFFFCLFLFLTCIRVPWTRSGRRANMFNVYTRTRVPIGTLTSLSAYFYPEFCALR